MNDTVKGKDAHTLCASPEFADFPPEVRRLITITTVLQAHLPDEDIEIVDAVAVYVNFGYSRALTISEGDDGNSWVVEDTTWDRTGGVSRDEWCGNVRGTELVALVKALLERIRREEDELGDIHELTEEDAEPRVLVDPSKFTHIQRVDNEGNPIGPRIPLKRSDS
jgi:hypothetical protein